MSNTNANPNQDPIVQASLNAPQGTPQGLALPGYTPPSVPTTTTLDSKVLQPTSTPDYQAPQYPSIYDISKLDPFSLTPSQKTAQDTVSTAIADTNALKDKPAFEAQLYRDQGYTYTTDANGNPVVNDPGLQDLGTQLTTLQNQAQAIPLQEQQNAQGRGITAGGLAPLQAADLRNNAIKALTISSLMAARQGKLATAKLLIDNAVNQKFGSTEAELNAAKANLQNILNSPQYDAETKQQAQAQLVLKTQEANQLDLAKTNYANGQAEANKYAPFATSDQLRQLAEVSPQGSTAVAQKATQLGLQQPQSGRYQQTTSTLTDAFGNQYQVSHIFDTVLGRYVTPGEVGGRTATQLNAQPGASEPGPYTSMSGNNNPNAATPTNVQAFQQYGLLSKSNFNPANELDQLAAMYIDKYVKDGNVPNNSAIGGRQLKPGAFAQVAARADQLFTAATGSSLRGLNPNVTVGYQKQLIGNNKLLNNLKVQEGTIQANAELLLKNLNANNINQNAPLINGVLDSISNAMGDPDVAAYIAQNITIRNELGSLLALKNAQGTTVQDKLEAANLLSPKASAAQIAEVVTKLMQEAVNAQDAIQRANGDLYKQTDPLMQDPNNPLRQQAVNSHFVEQALTSQGLHYSALIQEMKSKAPAGTQPALDAKTGKPGFATPEEIQAGTAVPL